MTFISKMKNIFALQRRMWKFVYVHVFPFACSYATLTTSGYLIVNHLPKECQHWKNTLSSWMIAWESWKWNWRRPTLTFQCQLHFRIPTRWRTVAPLPYFCMGSWCMSIHMWALAHSTKMYLHTLVLCCHWNNNKKMMMHAYIPSHLHIFTPSQSTPFVVTFKFSGRLSHDYTYTCV